MDEKNFKAMICCPAGVGSSILLKLRMDAVISRCQLPFTTRHGSIDMLDGFDGDLVITLASMRDKLPEQSRDVIVIDNMFDEAEIENKLTEYANNH